MQPKMFLYTMVMHVNRGAHDVTLTENIVMLIITMILAVKQ